MSTNATTLRIVMFVPTMQLVLIHLDLMNASALTGSQEMAITVLVSFEKCLLINI